MDGAKLDGHLSQSGRSGTIVEGILSQSDLRVLKLTVQKYQSGRSERVKVDGPKVSNQMVRKCQTLTLNALILIAL